jgi:hypothetical protein
VGIIARRYCGSLVISEKRILRRAASAEAAKLLGSIVKQGTAKLSKALWKASKGKVSNVLSSMKEYAKGAGSSLFEKVGLQKTKEAFDAGIEAITSPAKDRSDPDPGDAEPQ